MNGMPRSLYLYVNRGIQTVIPAVGLSNRDLYLYVNRGMYEGVIPQGMSRSLFLYVNRGFYPDVLDAGLDRSLYLYVDRADGEVSPYLNHINPTEQYVLGQVDLFGDGFGQYIEAVLPAPAVTALLRRGGSYRGLRDGSDGERVEGIERGVQLDPVHRGVAQAVRGGRAGGGDERLLGGPPLQVRRRHLPGCRAVRPGGSRGEQGRRSPGRSRTADVLAPDAEVSTYIEIAIASGGSGTNPGFAGVLGHRGGSPSSGGGDLPGGPGTWPSRRSRRWASSSGATGPRTGTRRAAGSRPFRRRL